MSAKRVQQNRECKPKISAPAQRRLRLFGPPLLLQGENAAAYEALRAHVYAATKPVDFIEEIFVNDFVALQLGGLAVAAPESEPRVKLVNEFLDSAGCTIDSFMENALSEKLDDIERIDRLTATAETRRNACLREIDRRRATLAEELGRSAQEVENGQLKVIEATPAKEKKAA